MEELKYDFVEEVIKKKPNKKKRLIVFMSLAIIFCLGAVLIVFLLKDNLKEKLFDDKGHDKGQSLPKVDVAVDDGEDIQTIHSVAELEERINKSIVSAYQIEKASDSMELLCTGVIMSKDDYVYILVPYNKIKNKNNIVVMFCDGIMAKAELWNEDSALGIAAVRVDRTNISEETFENISYAVIGGADNLERGYNFVYEGNPFSKEILTYAGNIAGVSDMHNLYDLQCRYIFTDVVIADVEDGFLFDTNAKLTGMVLSGFNSSDNSTISAAAVYDIYDIIYGMLNKKSLAYIGIRGEHVGYEIKKYINQDMPDGLYITGVDNTSAAYKAGIMTGDIVTKIDDVEIEGMEDIWKSICGRQPGDVITVSLKRKMGENYKEFSINVMMEERK